MLTLSTLGSTKRWFAERTLHIKVLVRSGQSFTTADAFILAAVLPNFGNDPIADHVWRGQKFMRTQVPDLKMRALPDIARANGKVGFMVFQYEKPSSPTRRFERIATTTDSDKDGNVFVVSISLTANSAKVLETAEAAYLEVLRRY